MDCAESRPHHSEQAPQTRRRSQSRHKANLSGKSTHAVAVQQHRAHVPDLSSSWQQREGSKWRYPSRHSALIRHLYAAAAAFAAAGGTVGRRPPDGTASASCTRPSAAGRTPGSRSQWQSMPPAAGDFKLLINHASQEDLLLMRWPATLL